MTAPEGIDCCEERRWQLLRGLMTVRRGGLSWLRVSGFLYAFLALVLGDCAEKPQMMSLCEDYWHGCSQGVCTCIAIKCP